MLTFTATEAPRADVLEGLREKRDRSYQDWADDFSRPQDQTALTAFITREVNDAEALRARWVEDAIRDAVTAVLNQARTAGVGDLEGASLMVSVSDLEATATLHAPEVEPFVADLPLGEDVADPYY